ncbi:MAG: DNA ligase-associated DEXH box helicase, partial [Cyanobacteria bacterium J06627_28]
PVWSGGYLAISDQLSQYIRAEITEAKEGNVSPEVACIMPILATQDRISHLPGAEQFLIECCRTREGQHLYVYPFEGRNVHEGLGFLWAYRFSRLEKATFTVSVNDYGFEILAPKDYPFETVFDENFFSTRNLYEEIKESLNISELTQRRFRGISQVAGLVFKGYPGSKKTANQVQISSSLIYEVFTKYEPDNLLLQQAEREVIEGQMEEPRLTAALKRMRQLDLVWMNIKRPSPLGFPLLVERLSSRLSNESLRDRIERLKKQWDK